MTIHIGGSPDDGRYGNSWVSCPQLAGWEKPEVTKNKLSFYATCPLTGIRIYVLRDTKEGGQIEKYLEDGAVTSLKRYIARLVLNSALYSEIDRAFNAVKQEEYERGRTELQAELRELLGL